MIQRSLRIGLALGLAAIPTSAGDPSLTTGAPKDSPPLSWGPEFLPPPPALRFPEGKARAWDLGARIHFGARKYGDDGLDDVFGTVGVLGIELDGLAPFAGRGPTSGFRWEAALFRSEDAGSSSLGSRFETTFLELLLGFRYNGQLYDISDNLYAYIGVGLDIIDIEAEAVTGGLSTELDETELGAYAHIGSEYRFSNRIHVGLDLRHSSIGEVRQPPFDSSLRNFQVTAFVGLTL